MGSVSCGSLFDSTATCRCSGKGDCKCFPGWYGSRCDMSTNSSCVIDTDCGGPEQGTCVSSVCVCSHGHAGPHCDPCEKGHYGSGNVTCDEKLDCSDNGRSRINPIQRFPHQFSHGHSSLVHRQHVGATRRLVTASFNLRPHCSLQMPCARCYPLQVSALTRFASYL